MVDINNLEELSDKYYRACMQATDSLIISAKSKTIDLTGIDHLSYSAVMRELRQQCDDQTVTEFLSIYKVFFDILTDNEVDGAAQVALSLTLKQFAALHDVKVDLTKVAAGEYLGDASTVGKYLSDIIRFTLNRISPEKRPNSLNSLVRKIYFLNEHELANKKMPASSSIGQALTFVKNVLFAHNPAYIRQIINYIVYYLRAV